MRGQDQQLSSYEKVVTYAAYGAQRDYTISVRSTNKNSSILGLTYIIC